MPHEPTIAVIVPCYNGATFLPRAIASIRAQNYPALAITVVDDGSTDGTEQVCRAWNDVAYLRQENQGPSAARNTGIRATSSEFVAFLDADDLWTPDHVQRLLKPFEDDANLEFAMGNVRIVELDPGDSSRIARVYGEQVTAFLIGGALYRRRLFDRIGLFDPALRFGEDLDWYSRMRQANTPAAQVDAVVLEYRKHQGGMTAGKSIEELNVMNVLRQSILRRRAARNSAA